jgi:hypothetical protein
LRLVLPLALLGLEGVGAAQLPDTARLYRSARTAEVAYERAARRLAPLGDGPGSSAACDEVVGRFCLYYDTGREKLPPEPPEIGRYRRRAIEALSAAFRANSGRQATVLPLIRILLEGKQPQEALVVAEAFRNATTDVASARMLLGLTRHAAADIPGAEREFGQWIAGLDSTERTRVRDVSHLLNSRERRRYRQLPAEARAVYHERFWRYADALYLTPGNETWTEHLARHVESKLLQAAPWVSGATSWGNDVAELTIRYGTTKARTRLWSSAIGSSDVRLLEHWDPEQMIYAAPALDSVLNIKPRPDVGWPLDTIRTISGHAPSTLRRMVTLQHQANVFTFEDGRLLRVDGALPLDSAARGAPEARAILFALDSALQIVAAAPGLVQLARDSMFVWSEVRLPPSARFYSMEVLEQKSRLAGRARFPIVFGGRHSLPLSDVLIAQAYAVGDLPRARTDEALRPRASLLLPIGRQIGIYAEANVHGQRPRNLRVRLRVLTARGHGTGTSMSWVEEISATGPTPIAATVGLAKLKAGRYLLELSVTDQDGKTGTSTRELVLVSQ